MREVLTLSLPPKTTQLIKKKAKNKGFDSVSGYIKYLIKMDDDVISADELLEMAKQARKDYKQGKLAKLNSIADLVK